MDDWGNAEKTEKVFEDESRWAGRTIFQLEGPEEEEPQEEEKEEGDLHDPADPEPPEGIWDFELEELVGEQEDGEMEEGDLDEHEEDEEKREEPLRLKSTRWQCLSRRKEAKKFWTPYRRCIWN